MLLLKMWDLNHLKVNPGAVCLSGNANRVGNEGTVHLSVHKNEYNKKKSINTLILDEVHKERIAKCFVGRRSAGCASTYRFKMTLFNMK